MSSATEGTGIVISERAQAQLRGLMEQAEKINGQINTYAAALAAGLDVPEGWQLDVRSMAFVAPPAPPEQAGEGVQDEG